MHFISPFNLKDKRGIIHKLRGHEEVNKNLTDQLVIVSKLFISLF